MGEKIIKILSVFVTDINHARLHLIPSVGALLCVLRRPRKCATSLPLSYLSRMLIVLSAKCFFSDVNSKCDGVTFTFFWTKNRDNPHKNGICFCLALFVFHFSQHFQCSFYCVATKTLTPTFVRGFQTTLSALCKYF